MLQKCMMGVVVHLSLCTQVCTCSFLFKETRYFLIQFIFCTDDSMWWNVVTIRATEVIQL